MHRRHIASGLLTIGIFTALVGMTTVHAAPAERRSCYDLDDDGACDAGDPTVDFESFDFDSIDISGYDYVDDDHPNVGLILDSAPLGKFRYGIFTDAPGDVHVRGTMTSRSYVSFTVRSWDGTVWIEDGTKIATGNGHEGDEISIEFTGINVSFGNRVSIQSSAAYAPELLVSASEKLTIGDNMKVRLSGDGAYFEMYGGTTTVGRKFNLAAGSRGFGSLYANGGDIIAERMKMSGRDVFVGTFGDASFPATLRLIDSVLRTSGEDNTLSLRGTSIELVRTRLRTGNPDYVPEPIVVP